MSGSVLTVCSKFPMTHYPGWIRRPSAQMDFPGGSAVKNPPAYAGDSGDLGSNPGLERSSREGKGKPLQYSCLGNPMIREAWWVTVHGVTKSWT